MLQKINGTWYEVNPKASRSPSTAKVVIICTLIVLAIVSAGFAKAEENEERVWLPLKYVFADRLNVRSEPSIEANIILTLERADLVFVLETTEDGWCRVSRNYADAPAIGWVYGEYLK